MPRWVSQRGGVGRHPIAFRVAVALMAPIVFFVAVELLLRVAGVGAASPHDDPSRGFLPFTSVFTEDVDADGCRRLSIVESPTAQMGRLLFNPQSLPKDKSDREFRIVCLGGSLTYGWPYDDRVSFPRLLEVGLNASAPGMNWRVVNLGAPGWGSARLRLIADEVTRLRPDLVILTSGNNELAESAFRRDVLGERGFAVRTLTTLARYSHVVRLLQRTFEASGAGRSTATASSRAVRLDDDGRAELVRNFRENVGAIASTLAETGIRVYLTTVPVNLRNCPPFARDAPGEPEGPDDAALADRYVRGVRLLQAGRAVEAVDLLSAVHREAPGSAQVAFAYSRALEMAGWADDAVRTYQQAVDLDRAALRSFGALEDAVRQVGADSEAVVVDLAEAMAKASVVGVPGDDLFLDNCHTNRAGTRLLAFALARAMADDGLFDPRPGWQHRFRDALDRYLADVEIPVEAEVEALKFLLWYYRGLNPSPSRARLIQGRIEELDPDARLADTEFRAMWFTNSRE